MVVEKADSKVSRALLASKREVQNCPCLVRHKERTRLTGQGLRLRS